MVRKALCIGINDYPGTRNDLFGCVNDANDWREVLERYGFTVQQLLNSQATKDAMCQGMERLVQEARAGDIIIITYSGHGSWIPDQNGDEPDGRDEVLCPYDIMQNRPLVDDELYDIFEQRARGVQIALISDSCNSGSLLRLAPLPESAAKQRVRFLPPEVFMPENELAVARERALRRAAGVSRPFGGILLSACQDTEYSYDAEFDRRPNGAFSYFALKALKTLPAHATYRDWHRAILEFLPNPLQPQKPNIQGTKTQQTWEIFGGQVSDSDLEEPMTTQVRKTDDQRTAAGRSATEQPASPWALSGNSRQVTRNLRRTAEVAAIPEGSYVTPAGRSNVLYRVHNGSRELVSMADLEQLGITQKDVHEVDSLTLGAIPVADGGARTRAIGHDLQYHLWSNLKSNHFMESWVWLQGTNLTLRTQTSTATWFGGYSGGVQVILGDAAGNRINHQEIRFRYGIDGRAFGSGMREDTEVVQLPQNVANAAETITVLHYWDPKVDLINNIIIAAQLVWEIVQAILEAESNGESVNAGGEPF